MQCYLAGEITQVKEPIPWVRCASGNVLLESYVFLDNFGRLHICGSDCTLSNVRLFSGEQKEGSRSADEERRSSSDTTAGFSSGLIVFNFKANNHFKFAMNLRKRWIFQTLNQKKHYLNCIEC